MHAVARGLAVIDIIGALSLRYATKFILFVNTPILLFAYYRVYGLLSFD
jgi:hypothetical protein